MITAYISLGQLHGAELWLVGWILCTLAYFGISLMMKVNRHHFKNILFWFMAAELLTDLGWALVYYRNSVYMNYGIGAVYGLILWPITLIIAGVIATNQNKKSSNFELCKPQR